MKSKSKSTRIRRAWDLNNNNKALEPISGVSTSNAEAHNVPR